MIVITHGDGDGIFSATLLKKYLPIDKIIFTQPFKLYDALRRIKTRCEVIIVDLCFTKGKNIEDGKIIEVENFKEVSRLKQLGCELTVIDHHIWDAEVRSFIEERCKLVYDQNFSASQLVAKYLSVDDAFGDMGAECDRIIELRSEIAKMVEYSLKSDPRDDKFRAELVENLAKGIYNFDTVVTKYTEYLQKLKNISAYLDNLEIFGKALKIGTIEISAKDPKKEIMDEAYKLVDIVIVYRKDADKYIISIGRKNGIDFDVRSIAFLARKFGGTGGGHDYIAGAVVEKSNLKKFLSGARELVSNTEISTRTSREIEE